jgi:membrane protease YdiL (CAAX protease family)
MTSDPQPALGFQPVTGQTPQPAQPVPPQKQQLLAPIWHTVVIVLVLLVNSSLSAWLSSRAMLGSGTVTEKMRILQYLATIALELVLLGFVWIGLRLKKTTIRELIGGRWDSPESFLLDFAIAFVFWMIAYGILIGLGFAMGLAKPGQIDSAKKLAGMLAPHTLPGLGLFVLLSVTAGFVEEIIFRGYLQRQFAVLSGNIYVGLVGSALVFGAGHGYEGIRRMILIFVFGTMFGLLALWRKSLRPGMIAHALHDSSQGILLFIATKMGMIPAN